SSFSKDDLSRGSIDAGFVFGAVVPARCVVGAGVWPKAGVRSERERTPMINRYCMRFLLFGYRLYSKKVARVENACERAPTPACAFRKTGARISGSILRKP